METPDSEENRELLELLWREPKARSRNSNFARFRDDRRYRVAVKHIRSLLAFRRELEAFGGKGDVTVTWFSDGRKAKISMWIPTLRLRRSLFVSRPELELLQEDPVWKEANVVFVERGEAANGRDKKL